MKLSEDKGVCAVVYDHSKGSLLVGTAGGARSWRFPFGADGDGQKELSELFGIKFASVSNSRYSDDSADIHKTDCGQIIIPVEKYIQKGNARILQKEYCKTNVYAYEYNKNASDKVVRGIKGNEFNKVRWVKLGDMFKTELPPATLTVVNCLMNHGGGL